MTPAPLEDRSYDIHAQVSKSGCARIDFPYEHPHQSDYCRRRKQKFENSKRSHLQEIIQLKKRIELLEKTKKDLDSRETYYHLSQNTKLNIQTN